MKKWTNFIVAVVVLIAGAATVRPVAAQDLTRIAATVNDDIISVYDLISRVRLAMLASRIEDTQENRNRVAQQIMRVLVEEKLQLQEAARLGITVGDDEIQQAVQRIEEANHWAPGQLKELLKANHIPFESELAQIKANIAWGKVVRRRLRPQVEISDTEIDEALAKFKANIGKPENRVAEIFLPVDNPAQAPDVQKTAEGLVQRIRSGVPFPQLAQQFSQSASAAQGGDMGYIQSGQLDPELDAAIARLQPREVSDPIRTLSGYHILYLIDRRTVSAARPEDTVVRVQQLILPLPANVRAQELASQMNLAQQLGESAKSCADLESLAKEAHGGQTSEIASGPLGQIPPDIREIVANLNVGRASPPVRTPQGVRILMVCQRDGGNGVPSREAISRVLTQQKLEMLARRLMRDLRQAATVDIRI